MQTTQFTALLHLMVVSEMVYGLDPGWVGPRKVQVQGQPLASAPPQPFSYSVEEVDWVSGGGAGGRGSSAREASVSSSAHLHTQS